MKEKDRNEGIIQLGGTINAERIVVGNKSRAIQSVNRGEIVKDEEQCHSSTQCDLASVFYSYSHKDEVLRNALETHLAILKQQKIIDDWQDRRIIAGDVWRDRINDYIDKANIILLLVSADFIASSYCYEIEMNRALARHQTGSARVVPIILRPVLWDRTPFACLQCLPRDGKPVTNWANQDDAWLEVAVNIRQIAEKLTLPKTN